MKAFPDLEKGTFSSSSRMLTMTNRPVQGAMLLLLLLFLSLSLYTLDHARRAGSSVVDHYKDTFSTLSGVKPKPKQARRLYAEELMSRPLATDLTAVPKLFHQSWINSTLPAKFWEWSHSCRKNHADWEWVLWTDEDNLKLVERYAPWFMDTYEELRSEIYRADAARNIYMHVFGGVYADLDTECLLPYDSMFAKYNISTISHNQTSASTIDTEKHHSEKPSKAGEGASSATVGKLLSAKAQRKAFFGRMGAESGFQHSIPNAWMASTPGHPFWVLPLESCQNNIWSGRMPEMLTGPVALYDSIKDYNENFDEGKGEKMDDHYAQSGWRHLYKQSAVESLAPPPQSLEVLPFWEIYPYSWERDGLMYRGVCWVAADTFDAAKCKLVLGLDHWGSHSITYWSHSWSGDGHTDENMEALSKATKKPKLAGDHDTVNSKAKGKGMGEGSAVEANKQAEEWKKKQEERENIKR